MEYCSGLESVLKAEACVLEWYTQFMASIEHILPPKFNMFGMCSGCHGMGLYAAANQHRIIKLFFGSPACIHRNPVPNAYKQRIVDHADILPSREYCDVALKVHKLDINSFEFL